jgi:hypothetical protein
MNLDYPKTTEDGPPIRHVISFFLANPFFVRMKSLEMNSELQTPEVDWILWELKAEQNQPSIFVYDDEHKIAKFRLEYCLEPIMDKITLDKINEHLGKEKLEKVEKGWLAWPETSTCYFRPVPRLRSPEILREMDWQDFVDNHVCAFLHGTEQEKDPRLLLVHKATILRGLSPYLNPHSIQCTQGGTGKSEFYFNVGDNFTKVTANTFLGYAKSPNEVYPGFIDGKEYPIGIDQIESQSAQRIASFWFNALERGEDNVASGGTVFRVTCRAIMNLLANPTSSGTKIDPSKSFRYLLYHLSFNTALGRRFAIICYGTDFKKIQHKPSREELAQWKKNIQLFRAVEEHAESQLKVIVESDRVAAWLNKQIPDYDLQVQVHADTIEDENVRGFVVEHATGAQVRVRAAALYAAMVDLLDKIALEECETETLLNHAEDILSEIVMLNVSSIAKIAANWNVESADYAKTVFRNLPAYLKEIVSAIELWHRKYPDSTEIAVNQIPYQPSDGTYTHLSKCLDRLRKRTAKGRGQAVQEVQTYFGIQLLEKPNYGWLVSYLHPEPNLAIEPLGKLTDISPLSPYSPFLQSNRQSSIPDSNPLRKDGEMEKTEKPEKRENEEHSNAAEVSQLGTQEGREAAASFLTQWCRDLDPALYPSELVRAGYTHDLAQATRFVQELTDHGLLGGAK